MRIHLNTDGSSEITVSSNKLFLFFLRNFIYEKVGIKYGLSILGFNLHKTGFLSAFYQLILVQTAVATL